MRSIRLGQESIVCSFQDITERKRADEALRESENRFRTLARTVPVGIISREARGHPLRVGPGSPGMARLEVVDQGTGIDPAILDRIFEPSFTTRSVGDGRGVGLGLSISHSIVAAHGGTPTVGSEVGKGSTFRMELPVVDP